MGFPRAPIPRLTPGACIGSVHTSPERKRWDCLGSPLPQAVDAVSAMIVLPMKFDALGWDVVFASVQTAFAFPPGFSVAAVSNRAMEKAKSVPQRGYYFDFLAWAKANEKNQTSVTPSIPHIMAINYQCKKFLAEGIENVWKRRTRTTPARDLVRERAELLGGRLTIESAPGAGTTVFVEVPLAQE